MTDWIIASVAHMRSCTRGWVIRAALIWASELNASLINAHKQRHALKM